MPGIVVGVDGSEESKRALRWALEEAALRRATVRAVYAWTPPFVPGALGFVALPETDIDAVREDVVEYLNAAVDEVVGSSGAEVIRAVVQGPPAKTLLDAALDADLLVVGTRGHGGFAELLLGSVSQQCAHHAACPVVIIPRERQREA